MASTVKMERDGKTADVHPDEVGNYTRYGWVEAVKPTVKRSVGRPKRDNSDAKTEE